MKQKTYGFFFPPHLSINVHNIKAYLIHMPSILEVSVDQDSE